MRGITQVRLSHVRFVEESEQSAFLVNALSALTRSCFRFFVQQIVNRVAKCAFFHVSRELFHFAVRLAKPISQISCRGVCVVGARSMLEEIHVSLYACSPMEYLNADRKVQDE